MTDWSAVQNFGNLSNLPPALWQQLQSGDQKSVSYGGYDITPAISYGQGEDGVGNNTLTGYTARPTGSGTLQLGDQYALFNPDGSYNDIETSPSENPMWRIAFAIAMGGGLAMDAGLFSGAGSTGGSSAASSVTGGAFTPQELASFEGGGLGGQGGLGLGGAAGSGFTFNPAVDSQIANDAIDASGGNALEGYTGGGTGGVTGSPLNTGGGTTTGGGSPLGGGSTGSLTTGNSTVDKIIGSGVTNGLTGGGSTTGGGGSTTGGGGGGSGFDWSSLAGLISGLVSNNNQNNASQQMLDYLKSRQNINDNMYKPGSDEYNALWNEMSAKDAAAGRNSQYGPRSVDLAARIAQLKMDANTKMTTGIGSLYQNAINQGANSNSGLLSLLGNLAGNGAGSSGLGGLLNQLFGSGNAGGDYTTIGGSNGSEIPGSNGSDNGGIQTDNGGLNTWPPLGD